MIEEIIKYSIVFGISSGLIAWLIRSLATAYINKDLEGYKSQLEQERFRFSKLHEKRANIIEEFYMKLLVFETTINSMTYPSEILEDVKKNRRIHRLINKFQ